MKKSTRIVLIVFVALAIILYGIIFLWPEMRGLTNETKTLEYGSAPVTDEATVYFVREEALFYATASGRLEYLQTEGTKLRKGVKILNILPESIPKQEDESKFSAITEAAGKSMLPSTDDVALFTAILSFNADGYEGIITPRKIESLKEKDFEGIPEGIDLKRDFATTGEPIYKLTDNNLWYMVYWTDNMSEGQVEELLSDGGKKVDVEIDSTRITTTVNSITEDDGKHKVVLKSDKYYEKMHLLRKAEATIIISEFQGPIISPKSVVERDEGPGVYVKQRNGSFKWIPIQIIKSESTEDKMIIAVGSFLNDDGEATETVNYYDEILVNPKQKGYK